MVDPSAASLTTAAPSSSRGYQVVARRYRPQAFGELVGQEQVVRSLSNAILQNRVAHAYLFCGARGVGKTTTARILAKCLNCQKGNGPTPTPCNQCDVCRAISVGEDVDVLEIDGASNRGIDEIRELRSNITIRPIQSRFKIFIIDEVHMLTKEAFNALLKTLEEPPEHVKFIFCTTEAEKIPITILSRCQKFEFASISTDEITTRLREIASREGSEIDDEAVALLARRAAGSMRDSQSLLEQLLAFGGKRITAAEVHSMFGTADDVQVGAILSAVVERRTIDLLGEIEKAVGEGVDLGQLVDQILGYLRDCMASKAGCGPESMLFCTPALAPRLVELSQKLGLETILAMMQILVETKQKLRFTPQVRVLVELALVRASRLEDLDAIPKLIHALRTQQPLALPTGAPAPSDAGGELKKNSLAPPPAAEAPRAHSAPPSAAAPPSPASRNANSYPVSPSAPPERFAAAPARDPATGAAPPPGAGGNGLDPNLVGDYWREVLGKLSDLTRENALRASSIAIRVPNRLVIGFSRQYTFHRRYLERPESAAKLRDAFRDATGETVQIEFITVEGDAPPMAPPPPATRPAEGSPSAVPVAGASGGYASSGGRTGGGVPNAATDSDERGSSAAAAQRPAAPPPPRMMTSYAMEEEIKQSPLVQKAQQLFTAKVLRVEPPDSRPGAAGN